MSYLHLGKGTVVNTAHIIGIFDLDITSQSHLTRAYLRKAEQAGQVVNAAEDIPRDNTGLSEPDGLRDATAPGGYGRTMILTIFTIVKDTSKNLFTKQYTI